jgi:SWI/SNF-related matrix-associated actin-dependent regulator of chromatin subfamily A member 5
MFFQEDRLHEIAAEEEKAFMVLVEAADNDDAAPPIDTIIVTSASLVGEQMAAEKAALLSQGFLRVQRVHFTAFLKASARWGRGDYAAIASEIMLSTGNKFDEAEIRQYSETFWSRGALVFDEQEWQRMVRNVEKGEKKLEETCRITKATREVVERFDDPWQELAISYGQGRGPQTAKEFTAAEDRCLLCLADRCGYGNWRKVKQELYRINAVQPDVFLDYFLLSLTEELIGKRCEHLMRLAERDVAEQEKKRAEVEAEEAAAMQEEQASEERSRLVTEQRSRLIADLKSKRDAEHVKVLQGRKLEQALNEETASSSVEKLRKQALAAGLNISKVSVLVGAGSKGGSSSSSGGGGAKSASLPVAKAATKGSKQEGASSGSTPKVKGKGGTAAKVFPAHLVDSLVEFVVAQKSTGIDKLVVAFKEAHSEEEITKKSIDEKIRELLIKDKNNAEKQERWRLMTEEDKAKKASAAAAAAAATAASNGGSSSQGPSPGGAAEKRKPTEAKGSSAKKTKGDKDGAPKKRKVNDAGVLEAVPLAVSPSSSSSSSSSSASGPPKEKGPTRAKNPFQFYSSENKVLMLLSPKLVKTVCLYSTLSVFKRVLFSAYAKSYLLPLTSPNNNVLAPSHFTVRGSSFAARDGSRSGREARG